MNERINEKAEILIWEKIKEKHKEFLEKEPRECAYEIAKECIDKYWRKGEISDEDLKKITYSVLTFLFAWNSTFYRGCIFEEDFIMKIKDKIKNNKEKLDNFRGKCICELNTSDKNNIKDLYESFLEVLACEKNIGNTKLHNEEGSQGSDQGSKEEKGNTKYSPVSTAKFLHIFCPNFFPLWDRAIAKRYGCRWGESEFSFESYWEYMVKVKEQVDNLKGSETGEIKEILEEYTILKLIDEYNYMSYTKGNKQ